MGERAMSKSRNTRRWASIGVAAVLALGAGCSSGDESEPSQKATEVPVSGEVQARVVSCPAIGESARAGVAFSLVEQLLSAEGTFRVATSGSVAQFRARESADDLRSRLHTLLDARCLSTSQGSA